jgi:membrane dipeptidase
MSLPNDALLTEAFAIAHRYPIVDGHVDLPYRLFKTRDAEGRVTEDVTERTCVGDFDLVRAREGGHSAPFMSIYVPAEYQQSGGARAVADTLIDYVEQLASRAPEAFALASEPDDVEGNFAAGRISLPMGLENGAALEGRVANLEHFYRRGIRYVTLTHARDNDLCDSSYDTRRTNGGLSALGRECVRAMNALGVMVDVSHVSDDSFHHVMELSLAPVIASHSSCRHFTPGWERNLSDAMIRRLADGGGLVMINFGSSFLDDRVRRAREALHAKVVAFASARGIEEDGAEALEFRRRCFREHPIEWASVEQVADHIDHVVALVGIDHVGLGSDFDGVGDSLPTGLRDNAQLPNLVRVLLARGYDESALAKVLSGNALRVWRAIRATAG